MKSLEENNLWNTHGDLLEVLTRYPGKQDALWKKRPVFTTSEFLYKSVMEMRIFRLIIAIRLDLKRFTLNPFSRQSPMIGLNCLDLKCRFGGFRATERINRIQRADTLLTISEQKARSSLLSSFPTEKFPATCSLDSPVDSSVFTKHFSACRREADRRQSASISDLQLIGFERSARKKAIEIQYLRLKNHFSLLFKMLPNWIHLESE